MKIIQYMPRIDLEHGGPVRAVLELRGGISEVLGIKAGDRVVHAMFGTN